MTDRSHKKKPTDIPAWSWVIASLGLMLVIGSAGFMLYRAFAVEPSPPKLVIEVEDIAPSLNGYLVKIQVSNTGGAAVAGLVVEGELKDGSTTVETSTVTVDYVPSGSQRKAGLFFSREPQKHDLQIQPKGYEQP